MLVQQTIGNYSGANGASATGTLSITPYATGSLLLVGCFQVGQTTAPTVSDPTNGSYAQIVNTIGFGSAGNGSLFWVKNTTTSALTITATFPGSTGWAMVVVEITGQTASPIGSHSTGNSWATELMTSGNVSGNAGDVLLMFGGASTGSSFSVGASNPPSTSLLADPGNGTSYSACGLCAATLAASYNAPVGICTGASGACLVIGVQIVSNTVSGTGAVSVKAALSSFGGETFSGTAAIQARAQLAASGFEANNIGAGVVVISAAVSGSGGETFSGTAAVVGIGTVSAGGTELFGGAAAVSAIAAMSGAGVEIFSGAGLVAAARAAAAAAGLTYPPIRYWPRARW